MRNHVQLELTRFHFLNRKSLHCLFICCIYESVIKIRSVVRILPPVAENIIGVTGLLSLAGAWSRVEFPSGFSLPWREQSNRILVI